MSQSWFDRFSTHPTPSATPPPRASLSIARKSSNHIQRPTLSQRSSSLSIASETNVSRSSAPKAAPHGSSLRNQVSAGPPSHVEDPLVVLRRIAGKEDLVKDNVPHENEIPKLPQHLIIQVDFKGQSLQSFAGSGATSTTHPSNPLPYEAQTVDEYQNDSQKYGELHKSVTACDDVLKSVEKYLTSFQADLGAVSAEIETLQSRSTALNERLENRKKVEVLLGPVVERISISPVIVKTITEGPLDENWIRALLELQARADTLEGIAKEKKEIKALDDLRPLLDDLSDAAIERIRNHLVGQIKSLRSPNINAQVIQINSILKFRDALTFLAKRQPQLADDITQAYIYTMRWYYQTLFTRYQLALRKMKLFTTDQHDTLGEDPSQRRQTKSGGGGLLGPISGTSKPAAPTTQQIDPFSLGRRIDRLKSPTATAMPSYLAEEEGTKANASSHYFETVFISLNLALVDNACFEFTFLNTFLANSTSRTKILSTFSQIFAPTLELCTATTKSLVSDSYDALGILLLIRLTQNLAFSLQKRRVPALDGYINGTNMLLWPRFQIIIDAHRESLHRLSNNPSALTEASSSASSSNDAASTAPHPITQRFANFLAGVLALSSEAADDEPVSLSLQRLRTEFETLLGKIAPAASTSKGSKQATKPSSRPSQADSKRRRFLVNNYSLLLTVMGDVKGKLAEEQRSHFEKARDAAT